MTLLSWLRRGRHHVARAGARSFPESRGYAVVERVAAEILEVEEAPNTVDGWNVEIIDGVSYYVRNVTIDLVNAFGKTGDGPVEFIIAPPGGLANFPALVDPLRSDVPLGEVVEPWHGKSGPSI